jgi:hypothetical protein
LILTNGLLIEISVVFVAMFDSPNGKLKSLQRRLHKFFCSLGMLMAELTCMRTLILICILFLSASAQQRPLITEDVDIIPEGSIQFSVGVDFLQKAKFSLSGLEGDLTRVGVITARIGLAQNVEIQMEGVTQNFLAINSTQVPSPIPLTISGNSTNDIGDFVISTKIKLSNEKGSVPSFGFKFGVQLPNSNQSKGIGTNQINAFGKLIFQKKFGSKSDPTTNIFGNLGIGILTAPLERFTQNDVLLYGLAGMFRLNDRVNLATEINGRANTRKRNIPLGTESLSELRIGTQIKASGVRFDTAAIFGLTKYSPRTGVYFGVTYQSPKIFAPAENK